MSVSLLALIYGDTKSHMQRNDTTRCLFKQVMGSSGAEVITGNWFIKMKDKAQDEDGNILWSLTMSANIYISSEEKNYH